MFQPRWFVFLGIVLLSIVMKIIPYLIKVNVVPMGTPEYFWSFTPELALSIYCGMFFRSKIWMLGIPLAIRVFSDALLAYLNQEWIYFIYPTQFVAYSCLILMLFFGMNLSKSISFPRVGLTSLAGAITFFLMTNGSIWLWGNREFYNYAYDLSGLMECYAMALPFFKYSLVSTVFFSLLLCSPLGVKTMADQLIIREEFDEAEGVKSPVTL